MKMTFTRVQNKLFILENKASSTERFMDKGDLFSNIKYLLLIGRLLFLIPCNGLSWESHHNFIFRRNSFPTAICLLIITWYIVKDIVGLKFMMKVSQGGVVGYAHPVHYFLISSVITFIYLYFLINFNKLKGLFASWENFALNYDLAAFALQRAVWFAVIPMIFLFIINALFSIDAVQRLDGQVIEIPENSTRLEFASKRLLQHWNYILPYSPIFTIFCTVDFVIGSLPRAFIISIIIVFSYALSRQYKDLVEKGLARITSNGCEIVDQSFWIRLVQKHDALTDLVSKFDDFLSPLIFVTYLTSLYLICMQLLRALSSATGHNGTELTIGLSPFIYNLSFFLEVFLLYSMSISAALLNDHAHKIGMVLKKCPAEQLTAAVTRLENRVNCGPKIGFSGLGCFVITKPFLLTIANAVITLEIVLLQAQVSQPVFSLKNQLESK